MTEFLIGLGVVIALSAWAGYGSYQESKAKNQKDQPKKTESESCILL